MNPTKAEKARRGAIRFFVVRDVDDVTIFLQVSNRPDVAALSRVIALNGESTVSVRTGAFLQPWAASTLFLSIDSAAPVRCSFRLAFDMDIPGHREIVEAIAATGTVSFSTWNQEDITANSGTGFDADFFANFLVIEQLVRNTKLFRVGHQPSRSGAA
jgi:hypothetical protein